MRIFRIAVIFIAHLLFLLQITFAQSIVQAKFDIYSSLKCCECKVSFDRCPCPEAKEMKAYIDALLESGTRREDIFYKVAKKFSLNTIADTRIKTDLEKKLAKEIGEKRPQIILDFTSFDFGRVTKKQGKISKVFKVSNKGGLPLIIKKIKTSCPCAVVSLRLNKTKSPYFGTEGSPEGWQIGIASGKDAEIELMVDLASPHVKTGKLVRDAAIMSNDPLYSEVIVRVEAEVTD